jgi:hypothetical protein
MRYVENDARHLVNINFNLVIKLKIFSISILFPFKIPRKKSHHPIKEIAKLYLCEINTRNTLEKSSIS